MCVRACVEECVWCEWGVGREVSALERNVLQRVCAVQWRCDACDSICVCLAKRSRGVALGCLCVIFVHIEMNLV